MSAQTDSPQSFDRINLPRTEPAIERTPLPEPETNAPSKENPRAALRCRVEVSFCVANSVNSKKTVVFGETLASLCRSVQETKSLYVTAEKTGISYSQAWRKIRLAESILEEKLFERHGSHGSTLTPLGKTLLNTYLSLNEDLSKQANDMFCAFENSCNGE